MTFCLKTLIIKPEKNLSINNAIILLHGYGGGGEDISMLTLNWKRFLPNTVFLCPDGPETCAINPVGFQWFDLSVDHPDYILEKSKIAEIKLNQFIEEVKTKFRLKSSDICLSGFSQGCMMSINLGLISEENLNSIVGFSGKIINQTDLKKRKTSSTKFFLTHGDADSIVSPTYLLEAKDFFVRNNIDAETHLIKDCGHNISLEASSLALKFFKKNLI